MRKIVIIYILLGVNVFCFGQNNTEKEQATIYSRGLELYNSLINDDFFTAKPLYDQLVSDKILTEFIDYFYKYKTAVYRGQTDIAILYIEKIISHDNTRLPEFCNELSLLYIKANKFKEALKVSERAFKEIVENGNLDEEGLSQWQYFFKTRDVYIKTLSKEKELRIVRSDSLNSVEFDDKDVITFDIVYNGQKHKTAFDTGVSEYFTVRKHLAEKMGLRKIQFSESNDEFKTLMNGQDLDAQNYIADSISFGGITLYNVPVTVFEDDVMSMFTKSSLQEPNRLDKIKRFIERTDVVVGLPTMIALERLVIDVNKKKIVFPKALKKQKEQNIYFRNNELYAQIKINDIPFVGFVDTGAETFVEIDTNFYNRYKNKIEVDTFAYKKPLNASTITKMKEDIPYDILKDTQIKLQDKPINYSKGSQILAYDIRLMSAHPRILDGNIGYDFFREIKASVLFDFVNMYIDVMTE